jgi:hypothetical protein
VGYSESTNHSRLGVDESSLCHGVELSLQWKATPETGRPQQHLRSGVSMGKYLGPKPHKSGKNLERLPT